MVDAKKAHEQKRKPEGGHGKAQKDKDRQRVIKQGILLTGRKDTGRNGKEQSKDQGNDVHGDRQGQALEDLCHHRPGIGTHGIAEIKVQKSPKPVEILLRQGLVEPIDRLKPCSCGLPGQGIEGHLHICGGARREMDDEKGNDGDAKKNRHNPEQFAENAPEEGALGGKSHIIPPCGSSTAAQSELPHSSQL